MDFNARNTIFGLLRADFRSKQKKAGMRGFPVGGQKMRLSQKKSIYPLLFSGFLESLGDTLRGEFFLFLPYLTSFTSKSLPENSGDSCFFQICPLIGVKKCNYLKKSPSTPYFLWAQCNVWAKH